MSVTVLGLPADHLLPNESTHDDPGALLPAARTRRT